MDVILDSNIYIGPLLSQRRNIFRSNVFVELFTYLRRTKSSLVIPGPVLHEVIKKYSDLISESIKQGQDSWTSLQLTAMSAVADCFLPNHDAEVKAFQQELLNANRGFEVTILEDYRDISLAEVVRRGVNRVRPANDDGEELRDVIIWLVALSHAKAKNSKVAFITDDGHFKDPSGNLHPDLAQDLTTHQVEVVYFYSIREFIKTNALELSIVMPDEIASMVKDSVVADLVTDRFKHADYEDVLVSNIQFQGAQKYKVGDDSSYVEAKYSAIVRYSEQTTPIYLKPTWLSNYHVGPSDLPFSVPPSLQFNSGYFTALQSGWFTENNQTFQIPSVGPTAVRRNHEAVVELVVSFRTESGASQSVEILQIEITKNTQVSEEPVTPTVISLTT